MSGRGFDARLSSICLWAPEYGTVSSAVYAHGHDALAVFESAAALSRVFGSGGNGSGREEVLEARALSGPRVRRRYPQIAAALASEPGDVR